MTWPRWLSTHEQLGHLRRRGHQTTGRALDRHRRSGTLFKHILLFGEPYSTEAWIDEWLVDRPGKRTSPPEPILVILPSRPTSASRWRPEP